MTRAAIALLVLTLARAAGADAEVDADAAFHALQQRASAGDPGALDGLEALGALQPRTRWSDNAWAEAARVAERAGQLARARRDLEQVIAIGEDAQLVERARATLARLSVITGGGRWDAVAQAHERLVAQIAAKGDPDAALGELETLVRANPGYPRANAARLTIARGWEREDDRPRALAWLREAITAGATEPGQPAAIELVRALIRGGRLAEAEDELATLARSPLVDRAGLADTEALLAKARLRGWIGRAAWLVLGLLAALAAWLLRRDAGSGRSALRVLLRPPLEVVFVVPILVVLVLVAETGNPLVARAVRAISITGAVVAWISGVVAETARRRRGALGPARAIAHALLAVIAVGAATYLAIDRDRMIDLVIETWRSGPAMR